MRVLIAEDSAVDQIMLRRVIQGLGHECLVASNGKEAWELYQTHGADVLLSDWMMPGLNGPDLCRRIRAQPGAPYTYVILLTVLDDQEHTRHGMQSGADDYLRKPLQINELELRLIAAERVTQLHRELWQRDERREHVLERSEALLRLAERIVAEGDADQLVSSLLAEASALTGGSSGLLSVWDEHAATLVPLRSTIGEDSPAGPAARQAALRAAQRRAPVILDIDTSGSAVVAAPLINADRLLGAIAVVRSSGHFTPQDAEVLHRLGTIGAAGLLALGRVVASRTEPASREARRSGPGSLANLPAVPTSLIGRDEQLEQLAADLRGTTSNLLTLSGPAGVGKTRLALAIAARAPGRLADEVAFVDLAPVGQPELVVPAIAQALGVTAEHGVADLQQAIGERHLLLILDNFEHVLPAAAEVGHLLAACPALKVLVTSRASLRLRREHVFPVEPLELPEMGAALTLEMARSSPAIALFVDRARAAQPRFALTASNLHAVTEICTRLDGLPLAIELAAARTTVLAAEAMVARLEHPLRLLTAVEQDRPERHHTLRQAIAWSYELLGSDEQRAFRHLAVFASDFSLEAAAAVWGVAPDSVLDTIGVLLDNSLVYRHSPLSEAPRFRLLETIREFALEQLEGNQELEPAQHRAATFFLRLVEQAAAELRSADQAVWLERLDREHPNLLVVLRFAADQGDGDLVTRVAGALAGFWEIRGYLAHSQEWLERALALADTSAAASRPQGLVLSGAARLAIVRGEWVTATSLAEAALSVWRELGERGALAEALADLALIRSGAGARSREARELAREGEQLARGGNDPWSLAHVVLRLAEIAFAQGWFSGAQVQFTDAVRLALKVGDQWRTAGGLEGLAVVAAAQRRQELALRLAGAAAAIRERLRAPLAPAMQALLDRRLAASRTELGDEVVTRAWAEGHARPIEELIVAFGDEGHSVSAESEPTSAEYRKLTRREREVAALVALGLRNYEIAEQLGISRKTAEVHVANVLDKLGMASRVQLASWALKEGLLQQAPS